MATNASPELRSITRTGTPRPVYHVGSSCLGIGISIVGLVALFAVLMLL